MQIFRYPVIRVFSSLCAIAAARASTLAAEQGIVELPAYTVTETRELPPPERWSYAQIDGFEILSNASERATRDLVQHFRRFLQALEVVWPGALRATESPTVLIICGRGDKFDQLAPGRFQIVRQNTGRRLPESR
jgi:hypothetical protein